MNSIQATNGPEYLPLAGGVYPVRQLKHREWAELQAWLKASAPSPMAEAIRGLSQAEAAGEKVSPAVRDAVLAHAQEAARCWPPRVGTWPWIRALDAADGGMARFVRHALAAGGTAVSEDEAAGLVERATGGEVADLIRVALHGDPPAPKATTGEGTTATTSPPPPSPTTGA